MDALLVILIGLGFAAIFIWLARQGPPDGGLGPPPPGDNSWLAGG